MSEDTWTTKALPLLEQLVSAEDDPHATSYSILQATSSDSALRRQLAALIEDGYVAGATAHWPLGAGGPTIVADVLRATPKGRRAAGQWPSGQVGDILIRSLESALIELPNGETKSRVASLLEATRGISVDVLSGIVSNVIKSTLGLP